jgi:hypothetical protein
VRNKREDESLTDYNDKFLTQTPEDVQTLDADCSNIFEWHADAAFAVHPDFHSQTEATMSMG